MLITVKFDGAMRAYLAKLDGMADKVPSAMAAGLNDGGRIVFGQVTRALKKQINPRTAAPITARTFATLAKPGHLAYVISAKAGGLPIKEFNVSGSEAGGVTADVWGRAHLFKRSFVTSTKGLYRARRTSKRMPIRALRGASVAKELVKDQSLATFERTVQTAVAASLTARLALLLK